MLEEGDFLSLEPLEEKVREVRDGGMELSKRAKA